MGYSLSYLLSGWNGIEHMFFALLEAIDTVLVRSISFEGNDGLRTLSFKKEDPEITVTSSDGSDTYRQSSDGSDTDRQTEKPKLKSSHPITNLVINRDNVSSEFLMGKDHEEVHMSTPKLSLPETVLRYSPRPLTELDAAATKLQKVYKSYRTRRNLADCAVVVEELWWKALDFATLKQSSITYYNTEKPETALARWTRARTKAAKVGKGLSKDEKAQKLALQHWLEAIDPRHRYGHNLHFYYDDWSNSKSIQPFFYWLDVGNGKEVDLGNCPRTRLQQQCIEYLGPKEREMYEVIVECGKLVYKQDGTPLKTVEGSKWIFVLSTSRALYVGKKKKGTFQHSSFLSGGATTAAGRLVAHDGILEAIWPYSGHYLPTEDNFQEFISFLEDHNIDLTNVKRCATDDDNATVGIISSASKASLLKMATEVSTDADTASSNGPVADRFDTTPHQEVSVATNGAKDEAPKFDLAKRLSCNWTSPVGPRIGCVRDYPTELQSQALEQVNLSPRLAPGHYRSCCPIPSPRPSPKIRISPRLSYMGLPSPRVPATPSS